MHACMRTFMRGQTSIIALALWQEYILLCAAVKIARVTHNATRFYMMHLCVYQVGFFLQHALHAAAAATVLIIMRVRERVIKIASERIFSLRRRI